MKTRPGLIILIGGMGLITAGISAGDTCPAQKRAKTHYKKSSQSTVTKQTVASTVDNVAKTFSMLDINGNGQVDPIEYTDAHVEAMLKGSGPKGVATNSEGPVSALRSKFQMIDADGDGNLVIEEMRGAMAPKGSAPKGSAPKGSEPKGSGTKAAAPQSKGSAPKGSSSKSAPPKGSGSK